MNSIQLKSRAKINLSIDVLGKRPDGYHLVEMIMQTIDLFDTIKITILENDEILIKSNSVDIPLDKSNIAYKAADLIKSEFSINKGIEIYIDKNIPVAAGMAGGSSNAAAILVGLNKLFDLNLSNEQLEKIGLNLGADVPFCISGNACLAENIGEKLSKIDGLHKDAFILVCKPNIFVSTKEIYEEIDAKEIEARPNNRLLIKLLKDNNIKSLADNMYNVLEEVTKTKYPAIDGIEKRMLENGALGSMMSGSGPTVFGLYLNKEEAEKCKELLLEQYDEVYVVNSNEKGVEIDG
ncbi:MAG: 4-(cytidine 5'-diphospho)-2-C-methyl-D-erythritol kinase [Terrisporobacter sp.]|uniref:4-(cytidine 5'-diphospho)-2-C-methyl-D-erythritol kinase n=1 Tax=Terrisporobacter sp. TaxID=1965305 RepID=UPI002FC62D46